MDVGEKGELGVRHKNTKEVILNHFSKLQAGMRSFLPNRLREMSLDNHIHNRSTWYFAGAAEARKERSLVMIDVDCKTKGSPEGAAAFLQFLSTEDCKEKYGLHFPSLYCEVSTNGRGGHGYFLIEKQGMGADQLNQLLTKTLSQWLNHVAIEEGFDIEFVEVKGTLPVIEWGTQKSEVLSLKMGQLAKIPRDHSRFPELRGTSVVTPQDLQRLACRFYGQLGSGSGSPSPKVNKLASGTPDLAGRLRVVPASISGLHFNEDHFSGLETGGRFREAAERLLEGHQIKTSGRQIATVEDVSVFLMIGECFSQNMNPDGSMPTKRWNAMWDALHEAGDIGRAYDDKRFAAVRDWLSSLQLIQWQDSSFRIGYFNESGEYVKGKAAKWQFSEELMAKLKEERRSHPLQEQGFPTAIGGTKEGRKREHPLQEQEIQDLREWVKTLTRLPDDQTPRPVEVLQIRPYRINPEELGKLDANLDRQWMMAA